MLRSKAKREFKKNKTDSNREKYKKIRNKCVKLIRRTKRRYFENFDVKFVKDNKKFWKTIQPLLNDKNAKANKIILIENDKFLYDRKIVAQTLNHHFVNITESLYIARPLSDNVQQKSDERTASSLLDQLKCFENHRSILKIMETFDQFPKFNFENVTSKEVREIIWQ